MVENDIPEIWPEGTKILIEVDEVGEHMLSNTIVLPPSVLQSQQRTMTVARVLRMGPDVMVRHDGPHPVGVGTRICFSQYGGFNLKLQEIDGTRRKRDLRLINDQDVLAILGDAE